MMGTADVNGRAADILNMKFTERPAEINWYFDRETHYPVKRVRRFKSAQGKVSSLESEASTSKQREKRLIASQAQREKDLLEIVDRIGNLAKGLLESPPGTAFGRSAMESQLEQLISAAKGNTRFYLFIRYVLTEYR